MAKKSVYEAVTEQIIAMLEEGTVPWKQGWTYFPKSAQTGKPYRGLNPFILNWVAVKEGYQSEYWLTYKQAKKLGGHVSAGEKGTGITFWQWREVETEDGEVDSVPFLRRFTVFNLDQCEDVELPQVETQEFSPIEEAERIISKMPNAPVIQHGGGEAAYGPKTDKVNLPPQHSFETNERYYSVAFHELAHSTGHPTRLGRFDLEDLARFGSASYSKEELTAELTAAMLSGTIGLQQANTEFSAAYIQGWLKELRDDKTLVVKAAGQAQKAADYIQGVKFDG